MRKNPQPGLIIKQRELTESLLACYPRDIFLKEHLGFVAKNSSLDRLTASIQKYEKELQDLEKFARNADFKGIMKAPFLENFCQTRENPRYDNLREDCRWLGIEKKLEDITWEEYFTAAIRGKKSYIAWYKNLKQQKELTGHVILYCAL